MASWKNPSNPANLTVEQLLKVIALQNEIAAARLDLERVMSSVVENAAQLTGADGGVVEVVDGDHMVYRATSGILASARGTRIRRQTSLSGLCIEQGKSMRAADAMNDPRVDRVSCQRLGIGCMICVPLFFEGTAVGVLKVASAKADSLSEADLTTLELLASLIAASMVAATAHESTVKESLHDALTGAANRRSFDERIALECARNARHGTPLCLAMLDLDGFKAANDRLGHPAGDAILREVVTILKGCVRNTDACFRLGGDEFAVILPDTPEDGAKLVLQRCTDAVRNAKLADGTVTVSAGLVEIVGESCAEFVERADAALYEAKRKLKR